MSAVHVSIKGLSLHIERDGKTIGHVAGFSYEGPVDGLPGAMQLAQLAGLAPTLPAPAVAVKLTDLERAVVAAVDAPHDRRTMFADLLTRWTERGVRAACDRLVRRGVLYGESYAAGALDWGLTAVGVASLAATTANGGG